MPWLRRLALMGLALMAHPAPASPAPPEQSSMSVRLHDYASTDDRQLRRAQREVAEMYKRLGVRTEWRKTVRPLDVAIGREPRPSDPPAAMTLILITEPMASRAGIRPEIAGYAATDPTEGGSIAYIVADRTSEIARRACLAHAQVLAVVMTHELAHLLVPRAHADRGIMRPSWAPADFGSSVMRTFSADQGRLIRRSVLGRQAHGAARTAD